MTYKVYGLDESYFTGKLEGYLRYKEIPYERIELSAGLWNKVVLPNTGLLKMPAMQTPDGQWMTDSSPMIDWLETQFPDPPILPADPALGLVCRLVEDCADEWLWRPAMHYRWSYETDARHMSHRIATEMLLDLKWPLFLRRRVLRRRQHTEFVKKDGVSAETWDHVEGTYLKVLDALETMFQSRPFMLGDQPSLADIGMFGPFFRHFGIDPTASRIMRERGPAVYEWTARLWNAKASKLTGGFLEEIPEDWTPLLDDIGACYVPYLIANAEAWRQGAKTFDVSMEGVTYRDLPASQYRVWCLEVLQQRFSALPEDAAAALTAKLTRHNVLPGLTAQVAPASNYSPDGDAHLGRKLDLTEQQLAKLAKKGTIWGRPKLD